jgi:hypothetical protein
MRQGHAALFLGVIGMTDSNSSDREHVRARNGSWVVVALLAIGVIAALVGLRYRQMPQGNPVVPSTRAVSL